MRAAIAGIKDNYNETAQTIGAIVFKKSFTPWFQINYVS
jgi:hypothetical protein